MALAHVVPPVDKATKTKRIKDDSNESRTLKFLWENDGSPFAVARERWRNWHDRRRRYNKARKIPGTARFLAATRRGPIFPVDAAITPAEAQVFACLLIHVPKGGGPIQHASRFVSEDLSVSQVYAKKKIQALLHKALVTRALRSRAVLVTRPAPESTAKNGYCISGSSRALSALPERGNTVSISRAISRVTPRIDKDYERLALALQLEQDQDPDQDPGSLCRSSSRAVYTARRLYRIEVCRAKPGRKRKPVAQAPVFHIDTLRPGASGALRPRRKKESLAVSPELRAMGYETFEAMEADVRGTRGSKTSLAANPEGSGRPEKEEKTQEGEALLVAPPEPEPEPEVPALQVVPESLAAESWGRTMAPAKPEVSLPASREEKVEREETEVEAGLRDDLRELAEKAGQKASPLNLPPGVEDLRARRLAAEYNRRMRKQLPFWKDTASTCKRMVDAIVVLDALGLRSSAEWGGYLDWLFAHWQSWKGRTPPANNVKSVHWIQTYMASMDGGWQPDLDAAASLLKRGGFEPEEYEDMVVHELAGAFCHGARPESVKLAKGLPPRTMEAALWLSRHWEEVGQRRRNP